MKKTKLSLGLTACILSVGALAGCTTRIKSSSDGVLLTYYVDGKEYKVKADDLLGEYYDDSSKYQAIYDTIYSVVARNYFAADRATVSYHGTSVTLGKAQMATIERDAREKVADDKDTAQTNADTNDTRYKKEFEAILESKGVETEEELYDKYVAELQKETFEKNFYTYYIEDIKNGATDVKVTDTEKNFWNGYFKDQLPYHVSHILVKLEDGSGTNYANGTISEANAKKLYNVVDALAKGDDSFSTIAKQYSEDPGSRAASGDLGIMDYSTGFVNEFKLGVYAYENYYAGTDAVAGSSIDATEFATEYEKAVQGSFETAVPTIDSKIFELLKEAAEIDKGKDNKPVLENSTLVYPRNIIYNKYLNRHEVAFITGDVALPADTTKTTGYVNYNEGKLATLGKPVLSVKVAGKWRPILCVRAGSDYQGIHFIVVNRSAFETGADAYGVTQTDYYTTFYPEQSYYPTFENTKAKTFVNFSSDDVSTTKKRAEDFASTLKSYDSDKLGKYIFRKYMAAEGVKLSDEKLEKALKKWIDTSIEKKAEERKDSWKKTWNEYIDTLNRQGSERTKLVPETCRLVFEYGNTNKKVYEALEFASYADFKNNDAFKNIIEPDIKNLKLADTDENGTVSDAEVEAYCEKPLVEWFKEEGGLCNDGKAHL